MIERSKSELPARVVMTVRPVSVSTSIIDIQGEVSVFAERPLMDAYRQAATPATRTFILNCSGLEYLNGGGIGLLIGFLRQLRRQQQCLLMCGLVVHYRPLLELIRLHELIGLYDTEAEAVHAAEMLQDDSFTLLVTIPSRPISYSTNVDQGANEKEHVA